MDTRPITPATLAGSVISVPPVARNADLTWNTAENQRLIRHLESGGVRTLLYGGNAVLGHVSLSEYGDLLGLISQSAGGETLVIPSVGPGFGLMRDQATILRDFAFPTAMLLPSRDGTTPVGVATGLRHFVERFARPAVLYIKNDGFVDVATVRKLMDDKLLSWIKYAVVRENPGHDPFLRGLIDAVGATQIVSGMGEQPAIVHMRDFGLASFTSGCVCIAPRLSMELLRAIQAKDFTTAEAIRARFAPLERLRDKINPVRVLHAAVQLAGIAETGPITPLLSPVEDADRPAIEAAARALLALQNQPR
jgi:dihydrodipicolinate synthase/N-acetylneuraminate lyase